MGITGTIDAHQKPPDVLKSLFKQYQKSPASKLDSDYSVVDFQRGLSEAQLREWETRTWLSASLVNTICYDYMQKCASLGPLDVSQHANSAPLAYSHCGLPGLVVIPQLLSAEMQRAILERTFHRDLSNPAHNTNIHFHHDLVYPPEGASFFEYSPRREDKVVPKLRELHKPMSVAKLLHKRLRWMTLGGQYDWTQKVYPSETPPPFPPDLHDLLHGLFPDMKPEAAIVNLYSPGDVLSLHRDVSEFCDRGLVSISIGCDGIFIVALQGENGGQCSSKSLVLRLRSGDAVFMNGASRFAWHGIPCVVPGTCPKEIREWPCPQSYSQNGNSTSERKYNEWHGWMDRKRINLNVRQMFE